MLGVFDRMEIRDRDAHERYEGDHGGAYQAARSIRVRAERGRVDGVHSGGRFVQSLSLLFFTATAMAATSASPRSPCGSCG